MRKRIAFAGLLALALFAPLAACGDGGAKQSEGAPEQVVLAIPTPTAYAKENTGFLDGVALAEEEIAAWETAVPLTVQTDDDGGEFGTAVALAQRYISDPAVIGVVGHWYSDICLPVSDLYKQGEKLLLVPTVSISSLTSPPSAYLFRNIPADSQIVHRMCDYAGRTGAKRAVVYYEDSEYGFEMAVEMERYAAEIGIAVVDRVCEPMEKEIPALQRKWAAVGYDVVFVVDNVQRGARFINALRRAGYGGRIVCSDGMDSASVVNLLRPDENNVMICSILNSDNPPADVRAFQERYRERYGKEPDVWAVQGYDSVMIVARAVADHGVRTTEELSAYFRAAEDLGSVYGPTRFDEKHEISGKAVYLAAVYGGKYHYIG